MSERQRQKDAVLNALRSGPKTIWQLTEGLRISRPGARIFELKRKGHTITDEWKEVHGRRVKVYTLLGHSQLENDLVSVHERTEPIRECAECHQGFTPKPKARPLRQGELPFCEGSHRARYHRRKKAPTEIINSRTGNPQDLPMNGDGA